jgi:hypothetical protein
MCVGLSVSTSAAELRWQGPPECDRAVHVVGQVEELVERSLEGVAGLDFEVTVTVASGTFRLLLVTHEHGGGTRSQRNFTATTCVAVTDAAAVAMAMTIRGATASSSSEPNTSKRPPVENAAPAGPAGAPPPPPRRDRSPAEPEISEPDVAALLGLGMVVDSAALPEASAGLGAIAAVRYESFRFELQGTLLPTATADVGAGREGTFQLFAGSALVCLERSFASLAAIACGGYELGQMAAEGQGVSDPVERRVFWQAARFELGAGLPIDWWLRLALRMGAAIPTTHSEFVLAGIPVHETPALSLRAGLGLEIVL